MKNKKIVKECVKWGILFLALVMFIIILENIYSAQIWKFDAEVYRFVSLMINPNMTVLFKIMTNLGGPIGVLLVLVLLLANMKSNFYKRCVVLNLIIVTVLNQILKFIIQRPRPTEFRIIEQGGYSFPSGHSMVGMAFYGFIIYLVLRNIKNKKARLILCTVLAFVISLIGLSRIYLGVHYASDVIGGFLLSIAYLIFYTSVITAKEKLLHKQ